MPPVLVYRGLGGRLLLFDGVTRARLLPGTTIRAEIIRDVHGDFSRFPTVGEKLP